MVRNWSDVVFGKRVHTSQTESCTPMHNATGYSFCGTLTKVIFLEILMVLSNFKPKNHHFGLFLLEKQSNNHKIGLLGCKKSLVPQIYHPVALCDDQVLSRCSLRHVCIQIRWRGSFVVHKASVSVKYMFMLLYVSAISTFLDIKKQLTDAM